MGFLLTGRPSTCPFLPSNSPSDFLAQWSTCTWRGLACLYALTCASFPYLSEVSSRGYTARPASSCSFASSSMRNAGRFTLIDVHKFSFVSFLLPFDSCFRWRSIDAQIQLSSIFLLKTYRNMVFEMKYRIHRTLERLDKFCPRLRVSTRRT